MTENTINSLWQWFPSALKESDNTIDINWRYVGDHIFSEPFLQDSLASLPFKQRSTCNTNVLAFDQFDELDCIEPSAFIFHSSRCGSTLLSQLLATSNECITISEAPIIDSALSLCRTEDSREQGIQSLKGIIRAFGQRRNQVEQHLFIKLDSWHIVDLDVIKTVFPKTPLFYVYRHPSEILSSHQKQRGLQMVPGLLDPKILGIDLESFHPADLDSYCLQVLTHFYHLAKNHTRTSELQLINYKQLPELIWTEFAETFSISLKSESIKLMQDRSLRHSKNTVSLFAEDNHHDKKEDLSKADADSQRLYRDLEQIRSDQNSLSG